MSNPRLQVDIGVNLKEFNQGMKDLTNRLKSVGDRLTSVGTTLSTRLTLPLVTAGGAAIKLASDFEESLNKVNVAFDTSAVEVRRFSETTLESFGIAQGTALDMAALFGDMATAMGLPTDAAADMSTELVGLAGDLASFKNQRIDVVQTALAGIFTGETESLKRLGIVMTQANLQAFALSQGIQTNIQDMTQAEQVNLRFAYVLSKTTNAQGDFARTSGGAANQMRIFQESLKELGQQFGQVMLPQFTEAVREANGLIKAFAGLSDNTKQLAINTGAFLAVIGPVVIFLGSMATNISRIMAMAPKFVKFLAGPGGVALGLGTLASKGIGAVREFQNLREEMLKIVDLGETVDQATLTQAIEKLAGKTREAFESGSTYRFELARILEALVRINASKAFVDAAKDISKAKDEVVKLNKELSYIKPTIEQAFPKDNIILDGLGLEPEAMMPLEDIIRNFESFGNQFGQKLPVEINKSTEAMKFFVDGFAAGLANIIVEGGKLKDMLRSIGRELLKSGLQKLIVAFLTGGIGTGSGFFGKGGGLLGSIFPKIFGAEAISAGAMTPALTGQNITVGGQFVLKGTDLAASIIRTNKSILR